MNLLFHPRVSTPPPMPGLHTHAEMIAAHKARQARYAAAGAREADRLRGISDEARQVLRAAERDRALRAAERDRALCAEWAAKADEGRDRAYRGTATYPLIRRIIVAVAQAYEVAPIDITSHRRTRGGPTGGDIVTPRQIAMYLAKTMTRRSMPEIGRQFGGFDHSTVFHAVRKMAARMAVDDDFRAKVEALRAALTEAQAA